MGSYGNDNLMFISRTSFITHDGTSDAGLTLDKETKAISIYATTDCWVEVGEAPVAVPATEKVWSDSVFVPAGWGPDIPVPAGSDSKPMKVAVIQASASGNCYIYQRRD
jgi:hypothetical protein